MDPKPLTGYTFYIRFAQRVMLNLLAIIPHAFFFSDSCKQSWSRNSGGVDKMMSLCKKLLVVCGGGELLSAGTSKPATYTIVSEGADPKPQKIGEVFPSSFGPCILA